MKQVDQEAAIANTERKKAAKQTKKHASNVVRSIANVS